MSRTFKLVILAVLMLAGCSTPKENQLAYENTDGQVVLTNLAGTEKSVLMTAAAGSYWNVTWSADGKALLYQDAATQELYRVDPAVGMPGECLSCSLPARMSVLASPSTEKIAFTTESGVFVSENGQPRQVSDRTGMYLAEWFPGEDALLLWYNNDIARLGLDGTFTNLTGSLDKQQAFNADVSPDGKWIAFLLIQNRKIHLMLVSADGATVKQLADVSPNVPIESSEVTTASVDWSPDGRKLAFSILMERTDTINNDDIYVINADGSGLTNLTNHVAEDRQPVWSPDGKYIAFISERTGESDIWIMNADGSNLLNLTNSPDVWEYHPFWMP
jgi:Tol biopolymer transport system component